MTEHGHARKAHVILKRVIPIGFTNIANTSRAPVDIEINDEGIVEDIGPEITRREPCFMPHTEGCYVSPGWIDLHTHIYEGVSDIAVNPDLIGPAMGVAALADAGSAGEANFLGFRKYIADTRRYPIKAFLNIGSIGLTAANRVSEIKDSDSIDLLRTRNCAERYSKYIVGIKVRASKAVLKSQGIETVLLAKRVAENASLPLMVHIGEPPLFLEELIENILGNGDIITHVFHGKFGTSILDDMKHRIALYKRAREKNIYLDVGHGAASFNYRAVHIALKEGIKPFTISTDLHSGNINGPVWSLSHVMAKMLALGMTLGDVLKAVTLHPAEILKLSQWGRLEAGCKAALTVFSLIDGNFVFKDSAAVSDSIGTNPEDCQSFSGNTLLCPHYTIIGGMAYIAVDPYQKEVMENKLSVEGE